MTDLDICGLARGLIEDLEPGVLESIAAAQSLALLADEQLCDEIFALVRNGIELAMLKVEFALLNLAEHLSRIATLEGQVSTDKRVEKDAERPNVCFLTVTAFEHFRSHVVWSSRHCGQVFVVSRGFGETEVNEAHRVAIRNHDVVGLDISVHDVLCMAMIERLEQLLHVFGRNCLRESLVFLLRDLVKQWLARHVLHHQVDVLLVVVGLVVLHDVGVVQLVQDCHFFHDTVDVGPQLLFVQHLDGHLEILVMLVRCKEHSTKGTHSEHLRLGVNVIVLLEFVHSLLFVALAHLD